MTRPFPSDAREAFAVAGELEAVAGSLDAMVARMGDNLDGFALWAPGPERKVWEAVVIDQTDPIDPFYGHGPTAAAALAAALRERAK